MYLCELDIVGEGEWGGGTELVRSVTAALGGGGEEGEGGRGGEGGGESATVGSYWGHLMPGGDTTHTHTPHFKPIIKFASEIRIFSSSTHTQSCDTVRLVLLYTRQYT